MTDTDSPTGTIITLQHGAVNATISSVGASLRGLTIDGAEVIPSFPTDMPTPSCSGVVLAPWPNRIRDGKWGGQQLAITEPAKNNASHGLLRYTNYQQTKRSTGSVTLTADVYPQLGYPFWLRTSVNYTLQPDGISVTHSLTNLGEQTAPFGIGAHPYLCLIDPGNPVGQEDLTVTVPAAEYFVVDHLSIPISREPVTPELDLRHGQRLSELTLDTGYTKLTRDSSGYVTTTLAAADGRTVSLKQGSGLDYVQVFTKSNYPSSHGPIPAIAVEPQTCAADAFNNDDGLRHLAPEESASFDWAVTFTR